MRACALKKLLEREGYNWTIAVVTEEQGSEDRVCAQQDEQRLWAQQQPEDVLDHSGGLGGDESKDWESRVPERHVDRETQTRGPNWDWNYGVREYMKSWDDVKNRAEGVQG